MSQSHIRIAGQPDATNTRPPLTIITFAEAPMATSNRSTTQCGVYSIINLESGRAYIGSSRRIERRWACHRSELAAGDHGNKSLQDDWISQKGRGFLFVLLRHCDEGQLLALERATLKGATNPYNARRVARAPKPTNVGVPKTAEHRANIAAALRGKRKSALHVSRMSAAVSGTKRKPRGEEWRASLRLANAGQVPWIKGKHQTETHRARIQASRQRFFYEKAGRQWPDILL